METTETLKGSRGLQRLLHMVSQSLWVLLLLLALALADHHNPSSESGPKVAFATVNSMSWSTFQAILRVLGGLPLCACMNEASFSFSEPAASWLHLDSSLSGP